MLQPLLGETYIINKEMGNTNISDEKHNESLVVVPTALGLSGLGLVDWVILVMMMFLVIPLGYTLRVCVFPLCRRDAEDVTELR